MSDVITGSSQVSATVQDIVASDVQAVLNASIVVPGTIMERQVSKGLKSVKMPKMGKFTVNTKVSGTALAAQTNSLSADSLNLDQHKAIQFLIEDIAELQSNVDVMQAYITQAGQDLAVDMDAYCISQLSLVSTATPDHKLAYDGASLAKSDILKARALLSLQNVPLEDRFAIISPDQEQSVLNIQEFTRVNESGSASGLRNGEFGKLFGFTFMISSQASSASSLFYHRSHAAIARQMAPKTEQFRDVPNLADRWSISHLYGAVGGLDSGKRGVALGTA